MNERERFRRVFHGEPVDRPPLLDEGVRDDVIRLWRAQGLPKGKTHLELFGLTPHENIGPDLTYLPDYSGRILNLSPQEYGRAFQVARGRFPKTWRKTVRRLEDRDHIVCLWAYRGFFQALGAEDWPTLKQVFHAVVKIPARVRDRMARYGDFCARMLEMALQDVQPEFIYLSEPISDNNGPLISPAMYEEFTVPAIDAIIAAAKAHECRSILVSTYGNTARLFPAMIQAGVTMLWISEAPETPELEYRFLRHKFGPSLGLIGGIPLSVVRSAASAETEQRLQEIVVPLLQSGRYVPLAGGRVRKDVCWESYRRYRELLQACLAVHQV